MGWIRRFLGQPGPRLSDQDDVPGARITGAPVDVSARNPLDLWHIAVTQALGGLALAPIHEPEAVLDVACGTGLWARDMARRYPAAQVVGFDTNGAQIEQAVEEGTWRGDDRMPGNCHLERGDALASWSYPDAAFDYTHARFFSPFLPVAQLPDFIAEMLRVTRPGGWIELVETMQFDAHEPARAFLLRCLRAVYERNGLALEPGQRVEQHLRGLRLAGLRSRAASLRTGGDDPVLWRIGEDLVAGMLDAAPLYASLGLTSGDDLARVDRELAQGSSDPTIRIVVQATWARRSS
jgi:ubiquinone/menaquinone biosynthesis C-methylase UbiE